MFPFDQIDEGLQVLASTIDQQIDPDDNNRNGAYAGGLQLDQWWRPRTDDWGVWRQVAYAAPELVKALHAKPLAVGTFKKRLRDLQPVLFGALKSVARRGWPPDINRGDDALGPDILDGPEQIRDELLAVQHALIFAGATGIVPPGDPHDAKYISAKYGGDHEATAFARELFAALSPPTSDGFIDFGHNYLYQLFSKAAREAAKSAPPPPPPPPGKEKKEHARIRLRFPAAAKHLDAAETGRARELRRLLLESSAASSSTSSTALYMVLGLLFLARRY